MTVASKVFIHFGEILKKLKVKVSHVRLFVTPLTIQSMEFSRLEYWSGQSFPSPGDLPNPGIKCPALQADSLPLSHQGSPTISYPQFQIPSLLRTARLDLNLSGQVR